MESTSNFIAKMPAKFTLGCSWGAIRTGGILGIGRHKKGVDMDLSCVMCDSAGMPADHVYSPMFRHSILRRFGLPPGKMASVTHAIRHSGDNVTGDSSEEEIDIDNERISVDTSLIPEEIDSIWFFVNTISDADFQQIPYVRLSVCDGFSTDDSEPIVSFDLKSSAKLLGTQAVILAVMRRGDEGSWSLEFVGDAFSDPFLGYTFHRIVRDYAKKTTC